MENIYIPKFYLTIDPRAPDGEEFDGASLAPFELNGNFVELQRFSNNFRVFAEDMLLRVRELEKEVEQLKRDQREVAEEIFDS